LRQSGGPQGLIFSRPRRQPRAKVTWCAARSNNASRCLGARGRVDRPGAAGTYGCLEALLARRRASRCGLADRGGQRRARRRPRSPMRWRWRSCAADGELARRVAPTLDPWRPGPGLLAHPPPRELCVLCGCIRATAADAVVAIAELGPEGEAVVGIRTIGTTLSAVVGRCALPSRGGTPIAGRCVPGGEAVTIAPCIWKTRQRDHVRVACPTRGGAAFMVVDEGPGMSGSSFLSVGESLVAGGRARVARLFSWGSRAVDPKTAGFSRVTVPPAGAAFRSYVFSVRAPRARGSSGDWRRGVAFGFSGVDRQSAWPTAWPVSDGAAQVPLARWRPFAQVRGAGRPTGRRATSVPGAWGGSGRGAHAGQRFLRRQWPI